MKVIILAGGQGTRLQEETVTKPKPMIEIGGFPILWHIMKGYSSHGFKEFVIALGYRGGIIKDYFKNYHYRDRDLTVDLSDGKIVAHGDCKEDWVVHLVDTGLKTETGGRAKRAFNKVGQGTFMMTYGDGVCDVDMLSLLEFHRKHGKLATVTAVRPPARFGAMRFEGDLVTSFEEKPQAGEGWINGGFFVLEPGVMDYVRGDDVAFEREPLERLAKDRQLVAYKHQGFWQCMDTLRDIRLLEGLWQKGDPPWKNWE